MDTSPDHTFDPILVEDDPEDYDIAFSLNRTERRRKVKMDKLMMSAGTWQRRAVKRLRSRMRRVKKTSQRKANLLKRKIQRLL